MHPHSPVLIKVVREERQRSNWLMAHERRALAWLCPRIPARVTSNMLTAVGLVGSAMLAGSLVLGKTQRGWLLLGVLGLAVNWFGDSLDGRLAYFRKQPRKWFGFALDLTMDWISLMLTTLGLAYYLPFAALAYMLMAAYSARMLLAVLQFKITDEYRIDTGKLGPTEARLFMVGAFVLEIILPGSLLWLSALALLALLIVDVLEFRGLLRLADERDRAERRVVVKARAQ